MSRAVLSAWMRGKQVKIAVDQIDYFSTDCKYIAAHYQGGQLLLSESLKSLEEEFSDQFIRIHRGAMVRRDRLIRMKRNRDSRAYYLALDGHPEPMVVSESYVSSVRQAIADKNSAS